MKTTVIGAIGLLALAFIVMAGDLGGIGVVILDRKSPDEPLRTGTVFPDTPASRAGIKPQSFLISIDGTNAVSMSPTQSMSMVRGPVGTSVTLELTDATMSRTNKFTVKRGRMVFTKEKVEIIEE
jgi:carboxyl-terminal processing protease